MLLYQIMEWSFCRRKEYVTNHTGKTRHLGYKELLKYQQVDSGHDAVIDASLLPAEGQS